jgi:3-dehydroquinate dehydratase/shikimate dehydrogenase
MPLRSPLPRVCVALGFTTPEKLLEQARREVQEGESFLEFRLDYLPDPYQGVEVIRKFLAVWPDATVLATCRRHQNHGHFNGSIEEQLHLLDAACAAGAKAVDLEIESAETAGPHLESLRTRTALVVSYHNFESTPSMDAVIRRMLRVEAWAYKVVTTARKPSDILRVLSCGRSQSRLRLVLLAMGEIGFPSRILSPAFGGIYTYAAPLSAEGTAAGQVCARQLRTLYRIDKLGKTAKIFGVIADPVRHSLSPVIHNRAMQSKRIDAVYLPFLVNPGHLRDFMTLAGKLPLGGFSVTIPHKQRIVRYLDIIDPLARRIGAVNTVWRKAGKWRGTNTDVPGVLGPLRKRVRLAGASVLIAGNGGAARGAAFALSDAGARVSIIGRNPDRVRALARLTGAEALTDNIIPRRPFDVFINATPLGMFPHPDAAFFPGEIPARIVFDMVYNPLETLLLRNARQQGLETVPGMEMFVEQAAHQFEIFTSEAAPRPVMEKAVLEALGHHSGVQMDVQ